jgi:zinc/manganese transport system ATP-binding protein
MAVVGPNGAGKSTLIQAILGIIPRQGGNVQILEHWLSRSGQLPLAIRQAIAYLPQNFLFDRRIPITVEELVGLGWDRLGWQLPWTGHRARRQAIRQALLRVDAWSLRHQWLSGLSGGETKRVLLAYCLVRPRRLLILDEAPAGLDLTSELQFYHIIKTLKEKDGWAVLQISHDLERVRRHCDRVLCLNQTLRCQGTPDFALSEDNLTMTYGSAYVRYRHSCQGEPK